MEGRNGTKDDPLYVICRSGGRGRQACERFLAAGYRNVVNVEGGHSGLGASGLPVVRGKKTISLERQVRIAAGSLVVLGTALGAFVHPGFLGSVGVRRCGPGLRRDHGHLWDGDAPGPDALEPALRMSATVRRTEKA